MPNFVKDVEDIRKRAREKMEEGAVTATYQGDVKKTVEILNEALATEIVCVLRYMHHYFMATGVHAKTVADEFKEHADEEREHADLIAERIQQLGGKPDFNPKGLLIFTAVLPQFVDRQRGSISLQLLLLGLICIVIALISDCAWGLLAGSAHTWLQHSPQKLELIGAGSGVALIGLGGYLALSGERL